MEERLNFYDFITFPDKVIRDTLQRDYPQLANLSQIRINLHEKYCGKQPAEIVLNYPIVSRRIQEVNHRLFVLPISGFQMLEAYTAYKTETIPEKTSCFYEVFLYHSEIVSFFLCSAFEKSLNIFNELFGFHINEGKGSVKKINERIQFLANTNSIAQEIALRLKDILENKEYRVLQNYRNNSAHNVSDARSVLINHRLKTGIVVTFIKASVPVETILETLLKCIELLGDYAKFIDTTIENYYDRISFKL